MLERAEVPPARREITRAADLRYPRQAYELTVPVPAGPITTGSLDRLAAAYHDKHRMTYGHASPGEPVQLVNIRVAAVGRLDRLDLGRAGSGPARGKIATRPVYFNQTGLVACDVVPREILGPGSERPGPVIVESLDTTVVVPPGWRLAVDSRGFIFLEALSHA
jgi:N-methylhydantoinase A